jgi:hypothetical protein
MARNEEKEARSGGITPTCKWCDQTVDPESCFADMVVEGNHVKWMCNCGKDVTQESESLIASSS